MGPHSMDFSQAEGARLGCLYCIHFHEGLREDTLHLGAKLPFHAVPRLAMVARAHTAPHSKQGN